MQKDMFVQVWITAGALQKQDEAVRTKMSAVQYHAEYLTAWSNLNAQLGGGFKLNKK